MRTPSSAAMEIGQLAGSLTSIEHDIERGVKQKGADEFTHDDRGWIEYLSDRIQNVETLLQRVRNEINAAPWGEK